MSTHCYYCDNKNVVGVRQQCLNPDFHYCNSDFVEYHKRRIKERIYHTPSINDYVRWWTEDKSTQTD